MEKANLMRKYFLIKKGYAQYLLCLIFLSDIFTRIYIEQQVFASKYVKAILSIVLIYILFKKSKKKTIYLALTIVGIFFIAICNKSFDYILNNIAQFLKYYSGVIFFSILLTQKSKTIYEKTIEFIFIFFSLNILFAAVFEITYFETYNPRRYGYMPLFSSQNEYSFIAITSIAFFYQKFLKIASLKNSLLIILSTVSSLLVGTKVIYLFIFLWFLYLIFDWFGKTKTILILLSLILINFLVKSYWINFLEKHFEILINVYEEKGFINAISSLRIDFFKTRIASQSQEFEIINYFFGGQNLEFKTEMSVTDIFLFFGIIGGLLYLYTYWKYVINSLSLNKFSIFYICSICFLSFIGGYYFESYSSQIYAVSFLYLYYEKQI